MSPAINNATKTIISDILSAKEEVYSIFIPEIEAIKQTISDGHTAIIVLVSIAIVLSIVTIIRQQKILRKLDEITKKTEEPSTEDKP